MKTKENFNVGNMITWLINEKCNFQCSYCTQPHDNRKQLSPIDESKLSQSLENLEDTWEFHVTGGEPFLERNIINLCKVITKSHFLSLNTNLSTKNIYQFADSVDPSKTLYISASLHAEEREKRDRNFIKFIDKVLYLQSKGFNIITNYVAYPSLYGRIKSDFEYLKSNGVKKIHFKVFRGVYNGKYYPTSLTQEEIEFLKQFEITPVESEILFKTHNYYGQLCKSGKNYFTMNRIGDLRRCSSLHQNYGNLFLNTYKIDKALKPCPVKNCRCSYEGINNAINTKGNVSTLLSNNINEKFFKIKHVMNHPHLLKKIKEKAILFLVQD